MLAYFSEGKNVLTPARNTFFPKIPFIKFHYWSVAGKLYLNFKFVYLSPEIQVVKFMVMFVLTGMLHEFLFTICVGLRTYPWD